ncbi:MAG: translation elongation factor Ts, partial [Niameybacter sp.]
LPWCEDASKTVGDVLTEKIATIGENLTLRRIARMTTDGTFAAYTHGGGKIIAVVEMGSTDEKALEVGRNVAMQVAAVNPEFIRTADVSAEKQEKEKEILMHQAINENPGKPENIIEKMVIGRLNKQLKEICLLEQEYVKDPDLTVAKYVTAELGNADAVRAFVRFETGEGIEKVEENFAEEVAKQMAGN